MRQRLLELDECLFTVFANSDYYNAQDECYMWAILEGLRRLKKLGLYSWSFRKARKVHECVRVCKIEEGSTYFTLETRAGWGNEIKICADCMAMILYFKEVNKMPIYMYTHWDIETQKPVMIKG